MIMALTCTFGVELRGLEPLTPTLPGTCERGYPQPVFAQVRCLVIPSDLRFHGFRVILSSLLILSSGPC